MCCPQPFHTNTHQDPTPSAACMSVPISASPRLKTHHFYTLVCGRWCGLWNLSAAEVILGARAFAHPSLRHACVCGTARRMGWGEWVNALAHTEWRSLRKSRQQLRPPPPPSIPYDVHQSVNFLKHKYHAPCGWSTLIECVDNGFEPPTQRASVRYTNE